MKRNLKSSTTELTKKIKSELPDTKKTALCAKYLLKSEPDEFSINALRDMENSTSIWDGVRNAQARNILGEMKIGDQAFFYHSNAKKMTGIYGVVEIVRESFPDPTASNPNHKYYDDAKRSKEWLSVEVKLKELWNTPVLLTELKDLAKSKDSGPLAKMVLLNNTRLSVQRVTQTEWDYILALMKERESV